MDAWRWAQENRAEDGSLPTGNAIAYRYGRHERWGRLVKRSWPASWAHRAGRVRLSPDSRGASSLQTGSIAAGQRKMMCVRGGTDPVSPHCSISYGADIDLQQTDGPYAL